MRHFGGKLYYSGRTVFFQHGNTNFPLALCAVCEAAGKGSGLKHSGQFEQKEVIQGLTALTNIPPPISAPHLCHLLFCYTEGKRSPEIYHPAN